MMAAPTSELEQYLTFHMAGEAFAVGILQVREILRYETVTRVPGSPRAVRGAMNVRGSVVPVVDLRMTFEGQESAITPKTCVVLVELPQAEGTGVMGLLADTVDQVIDLRPEDIEPVPTLGVRMDARYLSGLGRLNQQFVLILDIARTLSPEALAAREEPPSPAVSSDLALAPEPAVEATPAEPSGP
ncbi:purine-binding chemotaxis protein CheW [Myxococcaceae bacterium JPH2]|nr:purine-binding chemotaxis protein CheW [Myxococcaceae bacterium JPH2]